MKMEIPTKQITKGGCACRYFEDQGVENPTCSAVDCVNMTFGVHVEPVQKRMDVYTDMDALWVHPSGSWMQFVVEIEPQTVDLSV